MNAVGDSGSSQFTGTSGLPSQGINENQPSVSSSTRSFSQSARLENEEAFHIEPFFPLKLERLESALEFLGLELTPEQRTEIRRRLRVKPDDMVAYGEFVALAQELLTNDLPKIKLGLPVSRSENPDNLSLFGIMSQDAFSSEVELKWANRERDKLKIDNIRLQGLLKQKDLELRSTENELLQVREELQSAVVDSRSLRSRLRLAEEAQRAARRTEEDYEEVLRRLELELLQTHQKGGHQKISEQSTKLMEVELQLRKTEVEKKMYEVATERLLQCVVSVGENLNALQKILKTEAEGLNAETDNDDSVRERLSCCTKMINLLTKEAGSATKAVKSLLAMETVSNGTAQNYHSSAGQQQHRIRNPYTREATLSHHPQGISVIESTAGTPATQQMLKSDEQHQGILHSSC